MNDTSSSSLRRLVCDGTVSDVSEYVKNNPIKTEMVFLKAIECNRKSIVKMMIETLKVRIPEECLHVAFKNASSDCVEILIENGAKINAKNHLGFTPIFTALRAVCTHPRASTQRIAHRSFATFSKSNEGNA